MATGPQNGFSLLPEHHLPYKSFIVPNIKAIFLVLCWLRWGAAKSPSRSGASLCACPLPPRLSPSQSPAGALLLLSHRNNYFGFSFCFQWLNRLKWVTTESCQCQSQHERVGWGDTQHDSKQWIKQNIILLYSISSRAVHSITLW